MEFVGRVGLVHTINMIHVISPQFQRYHMALSRTPRGGALGQVSYGGVQLRGPNPYPILGKAGLRKHTLF